MKQPRISGCSSGYPRLFAVEILVGHATRALQFKMLGREKKLLYAKLLFRVAQCNVYNVHKIYSHLF